jgi:hypothetical protein
MEDRRVKTEAQKSHENKIFGNTNTWEAIVFVNNTPAGIDWTRIVSTTDRDVGKLKGGSASLLDPEKYAPPPWLTPNKAAEIWKLHTRKNKKFKDKKEASLVFWKHFKTKAKKPKYEDFSKHHLIREGLWKEEETEAVVSVREKPKRSLGADMVKQAKRKRMILSETAKIGATGKQPKSEKNIARLKLYRKSKVSTILAKNPEIKLGDIKYDIRNKYAEIVG